MAILIMQGLETLSSTYRLVIESVILESKAIVTNKIIPPISDQTHSYHAYSQTLFYCALVVPSKMSVEWRKTLVLLAEGENQNIKYITTLTGDRIHSRHNYSRTFESRRPQL